MEVGSFIVWGTSLDAGCLALTTPHDKNRATVGNGVMVALRVGSKAQVDAVYKKALELGGTDEGPPGYRGPPEMGYYFSYFRDPDGHKFAAFCIKKPDA